LGFQIVGSGEDQQVRADEGGQLGGIGNGGDVKATDVGLRLSDEEKATTLAKQVDVAGRRPMRGPWLPMSAVRLQGNVDSWQHEGIPLL